MQKVPVLPSSVLLLHIFYTNTKNKVVTYSSRGNVMNNWCIIGFKHPQWNLVYKHDLQGHFHSLFMFCDICCKQVDVDLCCIWGNSYRLLHSFCDSKLRLSASCQLCVAYPSLGGLIMKKVHSCKWFTSWKKQHTHTDGREGGIQLQIRKCSVTLTFVLQTHTHAYTPGSRERETTVVADRWAGRVEKLCK